MPDDRHGKISGGWFSIGVKVNNIKEQLWKGDGQPSHGDGGGGGGGYWQSTASPLPWRNLAGMAPQKTQSFEEGGGVLRLTAIEGLGEKRPRNGQDGV